MNPTHLVMHGLAVKKHASPEAIAEATGLDVAEVRPILANLVEAKRAAAAGGK